jgi:hypothetical protein
MARKLPVKTTGKKLARAANIERAVEMRLQRQTFRAIGAALGVSAKTAWDYVDTALTEHVEAAGEGAERLRAQELAHLDHLSRKLAPAIEAGEIAAINAALKIAESRRRLLGLDAPVRAEITGKDGGPFVGAFIVPGTAPLNEWSAKAVKQQAALAMLGGP